MKQVVSIQMDGEYIANKTVVNKNDSNELAISSSFEKIVFSDLQELLSKRLTVEQYNDNVITTPGISYKDCNKFEYGNVIKALQIIIDSNRKRLKSIKQKEAIAFLHLDVNFSPTLIRNILELFGIKLEISKIFKISSKVFEKRQQPKWLQNMGGVFFC